MKQNFTKADLKDGMIVTYREGSQRIVIGDKLYSIPSYSTGSYDYQLGLFNFDNNLIYHSKPDHHYTIVEVSYKGDVLWERKEIKLTDMERAWLIVAQHDGKKYIARDEDGSVCVYNDIKPHKNDTDWTNGTLSFQGGWRELFESANNLFQFISWTDDEPYLIEDLLKL